MDKEQMEARLANKLAEDDETKVERRFITEATRVIWNEQGKLQK